MTPTNAAPPLRVWAYTAAILVCLVLLSVGIDRAFGARARISAAPEHMNLERLDPVAAGQTRVIALGSSKAYYAVDYDDAFDQRLAERSRSVRFHRLTWLAAGPTDMQAVLERLARRPPDWLLVESDLLVLNHWEKIHFRHHLGLIEDLLDYLFGSGSKEAIERRNFNLNRGRDRFQSPQECFESQSPEMKLAYALRVSKWSVSTASQREPYLEWLRRLRDAGTKIVLLDIPRAPWADEVFPKRLSADEGAVLDSLAREEHFVRWRPGALEAAAFCDEAHMSAAGRARFSGWLAQRLADSLPSSDALLSDTHAR